MAKRKHGQICYLCGKPIPESEWTRDHVPPKQIYPSEIRKNHSMNLEWLPAHRGCNEAYREDEDYFTHAVGSTQNDTIALDALWKDFERTHKKNRRIGRDVLSEFSKIILPEGKIAKHFDPEKVYRIIWKIIRGLHFKEFSRVLPIDTPRQLTIFDPENPTDTAKFLLEISSRESDDLGHTGGVFDYRFYMSEKPPAIVWGLLFWDRIIFLGIHHSFECNCKRCRGITSVNHD